jgi:CheY-like chemotaxis protein
MTFNLSGLRVLIVEDHEDSRELLRFLLESCGSTVEVAGSGEEALRVLGSTATLPDIIVTDLALPDHTGFWLLEQVRNQHAAAASPAMIAVTGHVNAVVRDDVLEAGFRGYITKPIEPDLFCGTVAELAGRAGPDAGS